MIDLSTLIALLTALASATAPTGSGPFEPGSGDPPGQHCAAASAATSDPARSDTTRSDTTGRQPSAPGLGTLPVPLSVQDDWPETGPADKKSDNDEPQQLRADSETDDSSNKEDSDSAEQAESPSAAPTTRPESSRVDDEGDTRPSRDRSTTPRQPPPPERRTPSRSDTVPDAGPESVDRTGEGGDSGSGSRRPTDDGQPTDSRCADPPDRAPESPTDAPADVAAPSDLVELGNWYLTLPTGPKGDPDTIQPGQLAGYSSAYFQLNETRDGVVFTAPVDGATTRNSDYPRSELREMNGTEEAAWSNGAGTHTLRATEAVTELPESKPELVTAQIHGGDDDIMQIRLEGNHLMVQYADGAEQVTLDPDYRLGTPYDIEIVAAANSVQVAYNGEPKAKLPLSGSTWYFKAGAYVQSNPTKGDAATATGQVIIYSLEVDHR